MTRSTHPGDDARRVAWYYLQDAHANVTGLTDGSGAIVARYTYDVFGKPVNTTGSVADPFTFAAREYEPAAGASYFRMRWYDPAVGRFLSEDPIANPNLYAYVLNNPLAFADPMGAQALVEYSELNSKKTADTAYKQRHIYRFYDCGSEAAKRSARVVLRHDHEHRPPRGAAQGAVFGDTFMELVSGDMTGMMIRGIEQAFFDAAGGIAGIDPLANKINGLGPDPKNATARRQGAAWLDDFFRKQMPAGFDFNPPAPGGC